MSIRTIDDLTPAELNAMPKTARPIGVRKLSEKEILNKYADRIRHGKTARDHARRK
jgi:hypothetical protein